MWPLPSSCAVFLQWPTSAFTVGDNRAHTRELRRLQSYCSLPCNSISKGLSALLRGNSVLAAEGAKGLGHLYTPPTPHTRLQLARLEECPFVSPGAGPLPPAVHKLQAVLEGSLFAYRRKQFARTPRFQHPRATAQWILPRLSDVFTSFLYWQYNTTICIWHRSREAFSPQFIKEKKKNVTHSHIRRADVIPWPTFKPHQLGNTERHDRSFRKGHRLLLHLPPLYCLFAVGFTLHSARTLLWDLYPAALNLPSPPSRTPHLPSEAPEALRSASPVVGSE